MPTDLPYLPDNFPWFDGMQERLRRASTDWRTKDPILSLALHWMHENPEGTNNRPFVYHHGRAEKRIRLHIADVGWTTDMCQLVADMLLATRWQRHFARVHGYEADVNFLNPVVQGFEALSQSMPVKNPPYSVVTDADFDEYSEPEPLTESLCSCEDGDVNECVLHSPEYDQNTG